MRSYNRANEWTCVLFRKGLALGDDPKAIVGELESAYDVGRPAIWKRLRVGGALPAYNKKPDRPKRHKRQDSGESRMGPLPARVSRDPCPRCGVRGDIPCGHTRAPLVSA